MYTFYAAASEAQVAFHHGGATIGNTGARRVLRQGPEPLLPPPSRPRRHARADFDADDARPRRVERHVPPLPDPSSRIFLAARSLRMSDASRQQGERAAFRSSALADPGAFSSVQEAALQDWHRRLAFDRDSRAASDALR